MPDLCGVPVPGMVRVGAFDISIQVMPQAWGAENKVWGQFVSLEQVIRLDGATVNALKLADTLLHEIHHAIWWAYGIEDEDKEERIVNALGSAWLQIYRDNPELLAFINAVVLTKTQVDAAPEATKHGPASTEKGKPRRGGK